MNTDIQNLILTLNTLELEKEKMRRDYTYSLGVGLNDILNDFYKKTHLVKRLHNKNEFTMSFGKNVKFNLPIEFFNELKCDYVGGYGEEK